MKIHKRTLVSDCELVPMAYSGIYDCGVYKNL
ncbi:hypothetical protein IMSAGC011_00897 [Lachnospiraceae bacterium]|nr:hypothetical protein IMSAGC011_00897 [Lachnospiraceae bacterium]